MGPRMAPIPPNVRRAPGDPGRVSMLRLIGVPTLRFHTRSRPVSYERMGLASFDDVVAAHHPEIYRYLRRLTFRGSEADDLARDVSARVSSLAGLGRRPTSAVSVRTPNLARTTSERDAPAPRLRRRRERRPEADGREGRTDVPWNCTADRVVAGGVKQRLPHATQVTTRLRGHRRDLEARPTRAPHVFQA